jgi:hypothetical protein
MTDLEKFCQVLNDLGIAYQSYDGVGGKSSISIDSDFTTEYLLFRFIHGSYSTVE